jgi:formylglycine-generating enzyme required for sulfatase activity
MKRCLRRRTDVASESESAANEEPIPEEMVVIPADRLCAGPRTAALMNSRSERFLETFSIDRCEVTNHQYRNSFSPPATARLRLRRATRRASARCVDRISLSSMCPGTMRMSIAVGKASGCPPKPNGRRPCEARRRAVAMGNLEKPNGANWSRVQDGHDVTRPCGNVSNGQKSPYGVMDGAGNVMEWVGDWYQEAY